MFDPNSSNPNDLLGQLMQMYGGVGNRFNALQTQANSRDSLLRMLMQKQGMQQGPYGNMGPVPSSGISFNNGNFSGSVDIGALINMLGRAGGGNNTVPRSSVNPADIK